MVQETTEERISEPPWLKRITLTLPVPCISESCIWITIKLNFYFHPSLWCLKRFYEGLKGLHKTFWGTKKKCENKNSTKLFSLSTGLGRGGLNRVQKQSFADVLQNGCSKKFYNIHKKTLVLESLFNKAAGLQDSTGVFLRILRNVKNTYSEEHLRTVASVKFQDLFQPSNWCQKNILTFLNPLVPEVYYYLQHI